MNYEDLLQQVGGFGFFQLIIYFFLSYNTFIAGLELETLAVSLYKQEFHCSSASSSSFASYQNLTDQCYANFNKSLPCTQWNFSTEPMRETLVTEYALVCDRNFYVQLFYNANALGRTVCVIFGQFGDMWGRRPLLLFFISLKFVTAFCIPFLHSLWGQLVVRVVDGFSVLLVNLGYVMLVEVIPLKQRGLCTMAYFTPWCFGYLLAAVVSYYAQTWRLVFLVNACTLFVYVPLFFILPESPRWLLVKGRHEEAKSVLKRIARFNGCALQENFLEKLQFNTKETHESFRLFFTYRNLRSRLLVLTFLSWSICVTYYGLSLDLNFASSSIFINIALMGVMEIPCGFLAAFTADYFGRRRSTFVHMLLSLVCLLTVPGLPLVGRLSWLRIVIACLGKLFLGTAFCVRDVIAAELFPVSLKNVSYSFVGFFMGASLLVVPHIMKLLEFHVYAFPTFIVLQLIISMIGMMKVFPETKGIPLPDLAAEAESLLVGKEAIWRECMLAKRLTVEKKENDSKSDEFTL